MKFISAFIFACCLILSCNADGLQNIESNLFTGNDNPNYILPGSLGCTYFTFSFVCNSRCFFRGYFNGGQCFNNECVCAPNNNEIY
ncbi:unnamed protein product [Chironomus riparius]|uniref:Uncharacterized protein n=1 Tax=Chironomus riparius TaxID=315576 RepID=A0A9N9WM74_9DIPT|nr:unnamed protein product [Chironomus riparius]